MGVVLCVNVHTALDLESRSVAVGSCRLIAVLLSMPSSTLCHTSNVVKLK